MKLRIKTLTKDRSTDSCCYQDAIALGDQLLVEKFFCGFHWITRSVSSLLLQWRPGKSATCPLPIDRHGIPRIQCKWGRLFHASWLWFFGATPFGVVNSLWLIFQYLRLLRSRSPCGHSTPTGSKTLENEWRRKYDPNGVAEIPWTPVISIASLPDVRSVAVSGEGDGACLGLAEGLRIQGR